MFEINCKKIVGKFYYYEIRNISYNLLCYVIFVCKEANIYQPYCD